MTKHSLSVRNFISDKFKIFLSYRHLENTHSLLFGLSYIYERPILGDNPKPHKILLKSIALFTEKCCAFQHFSLKSTMLFMELHFSLKSTALFIEKHCAFHGVVLFTEKHCAFH